MTPGPISNTELSSAQFARAQTLAYDVSGIRLDDTKKPLVTARIMHRLRVLGLSDMNAYFALLDNDPKESAKLVDELTTNKTSFFREASHFDVLRQKILPTVTQRLRIWSAGCSSGEEPYTLAMTIKEAGRALDGVDVRILATDLSERMLEKARNGLYSDEGLADVPPPLRKKYFDPVEGDQWRVKPLLKSLIQFAPLNLQQPWPMKGPFNAIYCRNVMIYFDRETRQKLVTRFSDLLGPGGHFFVGHSESLTGITHSLRYVEPAAYARE